MHILIQFLYSISLALGTYLFYQRKLHPLAKFPGPFWASITRLYSIFKCYEGEHLVLYELHKKYGPVVRYGPNLLSFNDPEILRKCYSARSNYTKSTFYRALEVPPGTPATLTSRDNKQYAIIRRRVAGAFSLAHALKLEWIVTNHVINFIHQIRQLHAETGKPINFADWNGYIAADILTDLGFGEALGMVEKGCDVNDHIKHLRENGQSLKWFARLPELTWLIVNVPGSRLLVGPTETDAGGLGKLMAMGRQLICERMESNRVEREDMLQYFIDARDRNGYRMSRDEIHAETTLLIMAGSEPTAGQMTMFIKDLVNSPQVYDRLIKEIDSYFEANPDSEIIPYRDTANLPYLNACFKETLRMHPSVGSILPRVVPDGGDTFYGIWVPPGTEIACNPWILSKSTKLYGEDIWHFRPERWLEASPERYKEMESKYFGFGAGNRSCLGKNIACVEILKVIATLLRNFKLELCENPPKQFTATNITFFQYENLWINVKPRIEKGQSGYIT